MSIFKPFLFDTQIRFIYSWLQRKSVDDSCLSQFDLFIGIAVTDING